MQFSGDSKPCQQWNGPYVEPNVMTHKTIGVEYGMASTLLWRAEDGWQAASERERALQEGVLSTPLSPSVCVPLEIYFHSSIFIYASSPVECSGILVLSEPEWEVQLYFSCYTCILSIWHLSAEDSGPETKQQVVLSQKDDSSVKAMFKQQRIFHIQTGLRNCWKLFSPPIMETFVFLCISPTSGSIEASLFHEILICGFARESGGAEIKHNWHHVLFLTMQCNIHRSDI